MLQARGLYAGLVKFLRGRTKRRKISGEDEATNRRKAVIAWQVRLHDSNLSPRARRRWDQWRALPENRQEFDALEVLWRKLGELPRPAMPTAAELARRDEVCAPTPKQSASLAKAKLDEHEQVEDPHYPRS